MFLLGLNKFGKGDWKSISIDFVVTRTPTQVASHGQKYFKRLEELRTRVQEQLDMKGADDGDNDEKFERADSGAEDDDADKKGARAAKATGRGKPGENGTGRRSKHHNPWALEEAEALVRGCLLYTSPSPRDKRQSRMPSSA